MSLPEGFAKWEQVTDQLIQAFFEHMEVKDDLNSVKAECVKVLKDQSIILDLRTIKNQIKIIPVLNNLNLAHQNLRALSL